jgi:hypothetical protein
MNETLDLHTDARIAKAVTQRFVDAAATFAFEGSDKEAERCTALAKQHAARLATIVAALNEAEATRRQEAETRRYCEAKERADAKKAQRMADRMQARKQQQPQHCEATQHTMGEMNASASKH